MGKRIYESWGWAGWWPVIHNLLPRPLQFIVKGKARDAVRRNMLANGFIELVPGSGEWHRRESTDGGTDTGRVVGGARGGAT